FGYHMLLATLSDAGLDLDPLEEIFQEAGITTSVAALAETRRGIDSNLLIRNHAEDQPLRTLADIQAVRERLTLNDRARERSRDAFRRLSEVEAAVHGC
ncbi:TIGR00299 family protein, partial [Oceanidesulfovibrio marinus]